MTSTVDIDTADFYNYEQLLTADERATLHRVHDFMTTEVQPVLLEHWSKSTFPFEIVPGFSALGIGGLPFRGFGCPGGSFLLDGMIAMELARTDCSIATFNGVHSGLAMGSIYLCGSDDQRERFLPPMARFEKIGSFGLTEPEVGSGASRGPPPPSGSATSGSSTDRRSGSADQGLAEDRHSSLAKAFCTSRMRETVGWARELMGGNGILLEHNVGRFVADAEAIYSYEGTREMNTLIVGRSLTGLSAFV